MKILGGLKLIQRNKITKKTIKYSEIKQYKIDKTVDKTTLSKIIETITQKGDFIEIERHDKNYYFTINVYKKQIKKE